jgi:hypothetical protein
MLMMTRRTALLGGVTLFSALPPLSDSAIAQQPSTAKKKPIDIPPRERTLMDALLLARVTNEVTLTIGPQWESLPKENLAPQNGATPGAIAKAYNRAFRRFGGVAAIAPAKMDIINPNPTNPNPFEGMPESDLMPIFSASLKEEQWQALNSEGGLRLSSLSESQQKMIRGVFPTGEFKVRTWFDQFNQDTDNPKYVKEISGELMSGAIRIKESMMFDLPSASGNQSYGMFDHAPEGFEPYRILSREYLKDRLFGQTVRAELPNMPKKGELNLRSNIFLKPISVENATTVKEMMDRIVKATKIEIYADRRWHHKTLMILGTPKVATAGDLLGAMAYCLTGTFRKVGTAFVMTDDVIGYDTKRHRWAEFEKLANVMRIKSVEEAKYTLYDRYKDHVFSAFNDPEALTPEQRKSSATPFGFDQPITEPLSKFTPAQQKGIQQAIKKHEEVYKDGNQPIDKEGKISMHRYLNVELLVPSIDRPIRMDMSIDRSTIMSPKPDAAVPSKYAFTFTVASVENIISVFPDFLKSIANIDDNSIEQMVETRERDSVEFKRLVAKYPEFALLDKKLDRFKKISTQEYLAMFTHRGAWLTIKDKEGLKAEIKAEIEAAKRLSLTHLWIEVFTGGKINPAAMVLWDEAIALTKDTKIKIVPTMRVFSWGNTPMPAESIDMNALGETSKEREARRQKRVSLLPKETALYNYGDYGTPEPIRDVGVTPFSAAVREHLVQSLQVIAKKAGSAGVVLSDTNVPGYQKNENNSYPSPNGADMLMGYQAEMRLAFLRAESVDPLDIYKPYYLASKANTEILNYRYDEGVTATVFDQWQKFRRQAWIDCMQKLYQASLTGKAPLLCYEQTSLDDSYGNGFVPYTLWNDPKKEPPATTRNRPAKNPNSIVPLQISQSLRNQIRGLSKNYGGIVLETREEAKGKSLVEWEKELNKPSN